MYAIIRSITIVIAVFIASPISAQVTQLTDNSVDDRTPRISGSVVVWQQDDGSDTEILRKVGSAAPEALTNNGINDGAASIDGSTVVFQRGDGSSAEIWFNTSGILNDETRVTSNSEFDADPWISGTTIVWNGAAPGNTTRTVLRADVDDPMPVTDPEDVAAHHNFTDFNPKVSGEHVVWWGGPSPGGKEIYVRTGAENDRRVTHNGETDEGSSISGTNIVWSGFEGDSEIWLSDVLFPTSIRQITDNTTQDQSPDIDGEIIVWRGGSGSPVNFEIFVWIDGQIIQVSGDEATLEESPAIDDGRIVWSGFDGNDWEIFSAAVPNVESEVPALGSAGTLLLGLTILGTATWARSRLRRPRRAV